jgi:hypothetical protein
MTASSVDFGDFELYANGTPYELFARFRRETPVRWIDEPARGKFPGGSGYCAVFRHADVQTVIRRAKDRVWSLVDEGAVIYVCGDASRMEPDVRKTLIGVIEEKVGVDASSAKARFDQLVAENRYLVDVRASG